MQNQGNIVVSPRVSTPQFNYFQTLMITVMLAMPKKDRKLALPKDILKLIQFYCFVLPKHEELRILRPVLKFMNTGLIDAKNINSRVAILKNELPVCFPDEPLSTAVIQQYHAKAFACEKQWERIFKPEQLTQLLTTAAHKGSMYKDDMHAISIEALAALLKKGVSPNVKNCNGQTPLMLACFYSGHQVVELLLKQGADIKCLDKHERTALLWACMQGGDDIAILEALINQSVVEEVDIVNWADCDGKTPLMVAAGSGSIERVKCLLARDAHLNVEDNEGRTALDHAHEDDEFEVMNLLKEWGARNGERKLGPQL